MAKETNKRKPTPSEPDPLKNRQRIHQNPFKGSRGDAGPSRDALDKLFQKGQDDQVEPTGAASGKSLQMGAVSGIIGKLIGVQRIISEAQADSFAPLQDIKAVIDGARLADVSESDLEQVQSAALQRINSLLTHERINRKQPLSELAAVAIRAAEVEFLRNDLDEKVASARQAGASWSDISRAVGITPPAAQRRWDPEAKRKHREYYRERRSRHGR